MVLPFSCSCSPARTRSPAGADLLRVVTEEEGRTFGASLGLDYMETSAKTRQNVESSFLAVAKKIMAL